jgi:acyl carrier protein
MTSTLTDADLERMARSGMPALSVEEGVALFDAAVVSESPAVVPVRLDLPVLRAKGDVPAYLRGLIRTTARRSASAGAAAGAADSDALTRKLTDLSDAEREELLLDLVREHVAAVLGHASANQIEVTRSFQEAGFDSLTAVELRNRLNAATGLRLPATLVFDYPTAEALANHLRGQLVPEDTGPASILADLDRLEKVFAGVEVDPELHERVAGRLEVLRSKWEALNRDVAAGEDDDEFDFDSATDSEVFEMLDNELGLS